MTKRELVILIAKKTGYKQQDVSDVIQKTLDIIVDKLSEGEGLEFRNFGVFELAVRKPRIGRNPHNPTNDVVIPERVVIKFKPGKIMRDKVKNLKPSDIRPMIKETNED